MSKIFAVRGATAIRSDCREEITEKSVELLAKILDENAIDGKETRGISLLIGTTKDIRSFYPARAIRESGLSDVPLFSCAEPDIEGALPLCIRFLLTLSTEREDFVSHHVYLHEAAALRPDLAQK